MSSGPNEIEIKLRVLDCAQAESLLRQAGFTVAAPRVFEANNVYDTPGLELRSRGCLLRLRLAGDQPVLTFKGVAVPGRHKSRPETEVHVSDFDAFDSILTQLGFSVQFRYEKYRTEYNHPAGGGIATVDETPIGCFMELEGAPDWIDATASMLGFQDSDYVTASYGSLYLEHCMASGEPPTQMVFPKV